LTFSLENACCYDIETLPNVFTIHSEALNSSASSTWEISVYRDDRRQLFEWFNWLHGGQIPMIGFNSIHFDYPVIHELFNNPQMTIAQIYEKAMAIIRGGDRFAHTVWERDRFAPQIDLFKINHFDNKAKTTSLKALQINMRAETVIDSPVEFGTDLTFDQVNRDLIPYNISDVKKTKMFARHCMDAINFRIGLLDQFGLEVLNYNDTKIGEEILVKRLGEEICFDRTPRYEGDNYGRKTKRQTIRTKIVLNDIIFPYISFQQPEFNRVLNYLRQQVLTPKDIEEFERESASETPTIETKGVFKGLKANVGGIDFKFGTGGIHGSVTAQRIIATDEWLIRDIDVASLYPSIGIVNRLAPAHLGQKFVEEYARLPAERKEWQKKKGKKCVEANALKLAGNGSYGKTNSKFSVLYDPQYTMTITINGQLMLCMLHEWLMTVPTYQIIQINTDGITYRLHRDYLDQAKAIETQWQKLTCLTLEDNNYRRMFIRDVNSYIAESMDGSIKLKGAYWSPDPLRYAESISEAQPPAWHKDLGNVVSIRAAVAAMVHGVEPEAFIRLCGDPFDFMCRVKADRSSHLLHGGAPVQNTTRYYVARQGAPLIKVSPPKGPEGAYKRKNGLSDREYNAIAATVPAGTHDERIHTQNKSVYEKRETNVQAGWNVAICNDARNFSFDNVNYEFYIQEANKLIIA